MTDPEQVVSPHLVMHGFVNIKDLCKTVDAVTIVGRKWAIE